MNFKLSPTKSKIAIVLASLCFSGSLAIAIAIDRTNRHNVIPKNGYVPNSETAIAIAEAVLFPVYGRENIIKQKPYEVLLFDDYWVVEGTLKPNYIGGTFLVHISMPSGAILLMTHSK